MIKQASSSLGHTISWIMLECEIDAHGASPLVGSSLGSFRSSAVFGTSTVSRSIVSSKLRVSRTYFTRTLSHVRINDLWSNQRIAIHFLRCEIIRICHCWLIFTWRRWAVDITRSCDAELSFQFVPTTTSVGILIVHHCFHHTYVCGSGFSNAFSPTPKR